MADVSDVLVHGAERMASEKEAQRACPIALGKKEPAWFFLPAMNPTDKSSKSLIHRCSLLVPGVCPAHSREANGQRAGPGAKAGSGIKLWPDALTKGNLY